MPRPKRPPVVTLAPAHSAESIAEWKDGIDQFLTWASMVRVGETTEPAALAANEALIALNDGRGAKIEGAALWVILAFTNIRYLVVDAHWHLRRCPSCGRWLLAKDERRLICRRIECRRKTWARQQATSREALDALSGRRAIRARPRTK